MSIAIARRSHTAPPSEHVDAKETEHPIARFRPRELQRLMAIRHGRKLPMDEAGTRFRTRMLDTLAMSGEAGRRRAVNFLTLRCPWMTPLERMDAIEFSFGSRKFWSAEALGNDLDVSEAEREKAKIRTFRAAGMTDAAMADRQRAKDAARKKQKRRHATLHPKKEFLPAVRSEAIASLLQPAERCTVRSIANALKRHTRFAHLNGKALTTAVHNAVEFGVKNGLLQKDIEPGSRMPVAWISRTRDVT